MDFGLEVFQFNRICDCEHELQDLMISVSLVLISTAVASSFIESPLQLSVMMSLAFWGRYSGDVSYSTMTRPSQIAFKMATGTTPIWPR